MPKLKIFTQEQIKSNFTLLEANISKDKHNKYMSKVKCDQCNSIYIRSNANLKSQINSVCKSCTTYNNHTKGVMNTSAMINAGIKVSTKHGDTGSSLYERWVNIRARCRDKGNSNYGGRGIKVCDEWEDYNTFKLWAINNGYKDNLTIDRIDVNGDYTPTNCQWITLRENVIKGNTIDRIARNL